MTDAPKLKPCPFCGGDASLFEDYGHSTAWEVGCFNGDCLIKPNVWEKTKAATIAAWNARHTPPEVQALVDALRQIADTPDVQSDESAGVARASVTNWEAANDPR